MEQEKQQQSISYQIYLQKILKWGADVIKKACSAVKKLCFKDRVKASTGKNPLRCSKCGEEMDLYYIWHPKYGIIFDAEEDLFMRPYVESEAVEDPSGNSPTEEQMVFSFME